MLAVSQLARRFGRRWAVGGVSFEVAAGTALMLTGNNGSGKTTLLRCLGTALRAHAGRATLEGRDLWQHRGTLREQVVLLTHASRLWDDLSGRDNLRAWAALGGVRVDTKALLERVGLDDRPEPVRAYSAGMRRRLALARVLMRTPKLVLYDEPFSALDPEGRELVGKLVLEMRDAGCAVLMATHVPAFAMRFCNDAMHLDGGLVAARGVDEPWW